MTGEELNETCGTRSLEQGTPLRVVQTLLGHKSLNTTALYTHLARTWLNDVQSPLDALKDKTPKT